VDADRATARPCGQDVLADGDGNAFGILGARAAMFAFVQGCARPFRSVAVDKRAIRHSDYRSPALVESGGKKWPRHRFGKTAGPRANRSLERDFTLGRDREIPKRR
jgi:hypothetical protein